MRIHQYYRWELLLDSVVRVHVSCWFMTIPSFFWFRAARFMHVIRKIISRQVPVPIHFEFFRVVRVYIWKSLWLLHNKLLSYLCLFQYKDLFFGSRLLLVKGRVISASLLRWQALFIRDISTNSPLSRLIAYFIRIQPLITVVTQRFGCLLSFCAAGFFPEPFPLVWDLIFRLRAIYPSPLKSTFYFLCLRLPRA